MPLQQKDFRREYCINLNHTGKITSIDVEVARVVIDDATGAEVVPPSPVSRRAFAPEQADEFIAMVGEAGIGICNLAGWAHG